jgi:calcineurin-like phosphoesterase family protein
MSKEIWFSADAHLGHDNIRRFCNRPFSSVQEMDEELLKRINEVVQPQDDFYFLGDFAFADYNGIVNYRKAINCRNLFFIEGNHDQVIQRNRDLQRLFRSYDIRKEIKIGNQIIILDHYPGLTWNKAFHGSWQLFGHVHNNKVFDRPDLLNADCGVDARNFYPMNMDDVNKVMSNKNFKKELH